MFGKRVNPLKNDNSVDQKSSSKLPVGAVHEGLLVVGVEAALAVLWLWTGLVDDVGGEGAVEVPVVQTRVIQELPPRSAGTVLTAPHSRRVDLSQVLQRSRHCPVYDRPQQRHRAVA